MAKRKTATRGSIFVRKGTKKLTVKYEGKQYSTGYDDSAHGWALANEFLAALHERHMQETYGVARTSKRRITVQQAWREFERDHIVHKSPKTQSTYRYAFKKVIPPEQNFILSEERLRRSILDYINTSAQSVSGRNIVLSSFRVFCEYCYSQELISRQVSFKKLIVRVHKPVRIYSSLDLDRLIEAYRESDERYALLLEFLRASGARLSETLNVRLSDIESDRIVMSNKINKQVWQSLPLTTALTAVIARCNEIFPAQREYLFGFPRNHNANIYRSFKKMCRRLGIENLGLHAIRKTLATNLIQSGVDLKHVRDIMRHDDIQTTIQHYAEVRIDKLSEVLEKLHESTSSHSHVGTPS